MLATMLPLGLGFMLIHGGLIAAVTGGDIPAGRGWIWALSLWLRIFSVIASGQVWLEYVPTPVFIRELLASSMSVRFTYLLASPLLLLSQVKLRFEQIREAQLARGVPIYGNIKDRFQSIIALLFPLISGLLGDLPSRSAALDMKAFGFFPFRTSLYKPKPLKPEHQKTLSEFSSIEENIETILEIKANSCFKPESGGLLQLPELCLEGGENVLIQGGNGSGKSTLGMLLSGGAPEYRQGLLDGSVQVIGHSVTSRTMLKSSPFIQLVQQNPSICFSGCAFTVEEEVAFGAENLALPSQEVRSRVEEALTLTDTYDLSERSIEHLSGGEAQKVVLASALAMRPRLLILDEAFSRVYPEGALKLLSNLQDWGRRYNSAIIFLERTGSLISRRAECTKHFYIKEGKVLEGFYEKDVLKDIAALKKPVKPKINEKSPLLEIADLSFSWPGADRNLLQNIEQRLYMGERVALTGPNGAGKSTLLRLTAGLLKPSKGSVLLDGRAVCGMEASDRASLAGFLFQDPERQIFHSTVKDEILFSLRGASLTEKEKEIELSKVIEQTGLTGREKTHPLDLNSAERRMVAVASLAVRQPKLLLLDEPTRELDSFWLAIFNRWLEEQKATVLAITHDTAWLRIAFTSIWHLEDGQINFNCKNNS